MPATTTTVASGPQGTQAVRFDASGDVGRGPTKQIDDTSGRSLQVSNFGMALVSTPLLPITHQCLDRAELFLWKEGGSGPSEETVNVYPSALPESHLTQKGAPVLFENLISNRPKAETEVDLGTGWVSWDVTELVRTWMKHEPFPNTQHADYDATTIVMALRPPGVGVGEDFTRRFTSTEGIEEQRPQVRWIGKSGCTLVDRQLDGR